MNSVCAHWFTPMDRSRCYAKSIGILLALFSFFSNGATENQIKQIQLAAETHILQTVETPRGGELHIEAAELDSRIRATDCPQPLQTSASSTKGTRSNINVLVECPSDGWKVYVPVRLSTAVALVTANRALARGEVLSETDISTTFIELQRFRKAGFSTFQDIIGAKVKRALRPGDVIEQSDVCLVCRNEKVMIKAVKSTMTITTKGTALQDGILGQQVRVKNDKTQRIIEAQVTDVAEVSVMF
ncbi:flagellar basal body P-ring formation chaperone FlgA [Vibrio agarilyticus]|nr:flagellar basal body P-ring formation chaperone FlgA [Vibrio agarilyticus]